MKTYEPINDAICDVCSVPLGCCVGTGSHPGWGQVSLCMNHAHGDWSWKDFTRDEWANRHEKTPV